VVGSYDKAKRAIDANGYRSHGNFAFQEDA
jgi:hypothetical protein